MDSRDKGTSPSALPRGTNWTEVEVTSIIAHRNPLDQWFWEGGAIYVGAALVIGFALYYLFVTIRPFFCSHKSGFVFGHATQWRCVKCGKMIKVTK